MYNEDRKLTFLQETRGSTDFGKSVFRTTAIYEQEQQLDLCELRADVLRDMLTDNFGARAKTMDTVVAFMRSYVMWCKERGYSVCEDIYNVETRLDEKMRRSMVASPRHLQLILDQIYDPVEEKTIDCLYRCFMWMGFAGMNVEDTVEVKVDEIDFDAMLIEHGCRSYEIPREAVPAFRLACSATEFVYKHPSYEDTIRNRFPGEYLMRGVRTERIKLSTLRGVVYKALREHGVELTYPNVRVSGMFYQAYEMERIGVEVNFDSIVAERIARIDHKYHNNYTRNKLANNIRKELLDDYACWKAAFVR